MGAAERVFEYLQDHVPFSILGKFAAYSVGLTREDLEGLQPSAGGFPSLSLMARDQQERFRTNNYELWTKLYRVPPEFNQLGSLEWFDHLPGGVISHPYDPLLMLMLCREESGDDVAEVLTVERIGDPLKQHKAVGNSENSSGIPNALSTRKALIALMQEGVACYLQRNGRRRAQIPI
jgi:hypothetical protein